MHDLRRAYLFAGVVVAVILLGAGAVLLFSGGGGGQKIKVESLKLTTDTSFIHGAIYIDFTLSNQNGLPITSVVVTFDQASTRPYSTTNVSASNPIPAGQSSSLRYVLTGFVTQGQNYNVTIGVTFSDNSTASYSAMVKP
jgi:hypothetical protein